MRPDSDDTAAAAFRYGWSRWTHASRSRRFARHVPQRHPAALVGRSDAGGLVVAGVTQEPSCIRTLRRHDVVREAADFLPRECGFDLAGWQQLATLMPEWVRKTARTGR